jgi:lysylphosphatidylglycerol synthetase-like protein (DUF2156 family)
MKNKIKSLTSAVSVAILTAPALAMAQFTVPSDSGLSSAPITDIVRNFMKWILIIVGIMGVIGFAIAGILYLTAAGDEDRIKSAKSAMIMSIVGVVVALLGLVIMNAVYNMLGAQSGF